MQLSGAKLPRFFMPQSGTHGRADDCTVFWNYPQCETASFHGCSIFLKLPSTCVSQTAGCNTPEFCGLPHPNRLVRRCMIRSLVKVCGEKGLALVKNRVNEFHTTTPIVNSRRDNVSWRYRIPIWSSFLLRIMPILLLMVTNSASGCMLSGNLDDVLLHDATQHG